MIDNGRNDEKIIAIPYNDPTYNEYKNIDQLPKHIFDEMSHFFTVYKALENKDTAVDEVKDNISAIEIIKTAIENYQPFAVDASSSLETEGYKDKEKMTAFVNAVRGL